MLLILIGDFELSVQCSISDVAIKDSCQSVTL